VALSVHAGWLGRTLSALVWIYLKGLPTHVLKVGSSAHGAVVRWWNI
jgi:hypothetical protein